MDYVDPTGEIANIITEGVVGGLVGGAFGFIGSAASQPIGGQGFSLRRAAGAAMAAINNISNALRKQHKVNGRNAIKLIA